MQIRIIPEQSISYFLDLAEQYNQNKFYQRYKFEEYLPGNNNNDENHPNVWYGSFDGERLGALLTLKYGYVNEDTVLIAEVQCFVHGYGRPLIQHILDNFENVWWATDNSHGYEDEAVLVEYYRSFGVNEYYIDHSVWVDGKHQHFFYKSEDEEHANDIVKNIKMARCKQIDFPEDEIYKISQQDTIFTHRVSDDFSKFNINDIVVTSWGSVYKVVKKLELNNIDESPFVDKLTDQQYDYLQNFDEVAILNLKKMQMPEDEQDINENQETNKITPDKIRQIFDEVVYDYKNLLDIDMSYMKLKISRDNEYANGDPCYDYEPDEWAGTHTNCGYIIINPEIDLCFKNYNLQESIKEFTKQIVAHELAHEVWANPYLADEDFKQEILLKADDENFNTVYLDTVSDDKIAEETFCEYLSNYIFKNGSKLSLVSESWQDREEVNKLKNRNDGTYQLKYEEVFKMLRYLKTNNKRFDIHQFRKFKTVKDSMIWFGQFKDKELTALAAVVGNYPASGYYYINEIQALITGGSGRKLLNGIISKLKKVWLMADPNSTMALKNYYRSLGLKEIQIDNNVISNNTIYFFYTEDCDEDVIRKELEKYKKH